MKIDIAGVKIDSLTKTQFVDKVAGFLESNSPHYIVTPYSEFIVRAQHDTEFKNILNSADVAVADGMGVVLAGRILKTGRKGILKSVGEVVLAGCAALFFPARFKSAYTDLEKISGVDLVWDIARIADKSGKSVFLLGGWGKTPGAVAARLKNLFPKLKVVGTYTGTSEAKEEGEIVDIINKAKPDVLLVAFGPVKQEKWIARNLEKTSSVKLAIGLGGTFDYIAGKKTLAPRIMRERGLEWLFRLFSQPWRIGRMINAVPRFLLVIIKNKIKK